MSTVDRRVLIALQAVLVAVPLLLGGRHPWTVSLAGPVVLTLLLLTLRARQLAGGGPPVTGVAALAAFVAIALVTTLPLPPILLRLLSPATARLYAETLPGWPGEGGWSTWRSLAIDPYGVWAEMTRLTLAFGAFAVMIAYPWRTDLPGENADAAVSARLLLTFLVTGTAVAGLALMSQLAGNGYVLWITDAAASTSRASGPFVNPNHFAAWLEMLLPVALGFAVALATRVRRHVAAAAHSARGMGVNARRAWITAVISHQRALALPLAAGAAVMLMAVAHLATGSRAGSAALLVGLAIAVAGMLASNQRKQRMSRLPAWLPAACAAVLVLASVGTLALWATADGDDASVVASDVVDVNLTSRLAVAAQGRAIVASHPLFGTGMGSWLHAFRPHQAPPVEGGIWDHAHNDYLELAAESGLAGAAAAVAFCFAVVATVVRQRRARREEAAERRKIRGTHLPPGFEISEWRAALRDGAPIRWGIAGGLGAVLFHSWVDFGLRMPGNLLTLFALTGLLVLTSRRHTAPASDEALSLPLDEETAFDTDGVAPHRKTTMPPEPALAALTALAFVAAIGPTVNTLRMTAGAMPLAPRDALVATDLTLAEEGDDGRERAAALVRHALDWSPADRDAHEMAAAVAGPGPDGDAALRRAIALSPWAPELRDALAFRLADDGQAQAAATELEESMFRYPYLVSHDYMRTTLPLTGRTPAERLRALADGDTVPVRLAALDDVTAGAIERGLGRALDATPPGVVRAGILNDLALLLEARDRHADAARLLRAEAAASHDGRLLMARAARNALRVGDLATAEEVLLAALAENPDEGRLYRDLAVGVYAARGDFASAETVLTAGERNALDMLPVHRGKTEFLERRAAAEDDRTASLWAATGVADAGDGTGAPMEAP